MAFAKCAEQQSKLCNPSSGDASKWKYKKIGKNSKLGIHSAQKFFSQVGGGTPKILANMLNLT